MSIGVDLTSGENTLQSEMRRIVEALYGPPVRSLPGLDVGRAYRGAQNDSPFGGDIVDVFHYDHGCTSLAVVDITGHGMRAATHAGLIKHALRAYVSRGFDALESVRSLNKLFIENAVFENEDETFATLFFAIIQPDRRSMHYVAAGIESMVLLHHERGEMLGATGPIIGLIDDPAAYSQRTIRLAVGNIVAAVTDGFSEARNVNREFLGTDVMMDIILANPLRDAEHQAEALTRYAYDYTGEQLHDDVGALVVKIRA